MFILDLMHIFKRGTPRLFSGHKHRLNNEISRFLGIGLFLFNGVFWEEIFIGYFGIYKHREHIKCGLGRVPSYLSQLAPLWPTAPVLYISLKIISWIQFHKLNKSIVKQKFSELKYRLFYTIHHLLVPNYIRYKTFRLELNRGKALWRRLGHSLKGKRITHNFFPF